MKNPDRYPENQTAEIFSAVVPDEQATSQAAAMPSLLDQAVGLGAEDALPTHGLAEFLEASSTQQALEIWLGRPLSPSRDSPSQLARTLNRHVAQIDQLVNRQLNEIIHNARFQKLEASWRGVDYLCNVTEREYIPGNSPVKLKILDISSRELEADFENAWDVEQSHVFYKVYEQEFGRAGGEPFGLLIGDYEIKPPTLPGYAHDDFNVLENMAKVGASAFSPFVCNASPELFELDDFGEMEETRDYRTAFDGVRNVRWRSLCESEDSRFIGMTLPRVLMRLPYDHRAAMTKAKRENRRRGVSVIAHEFCFEESSTAGAKPGLWGGAAFAFAGVAMRSYCRTNWLADIRGVQRGVDGGGLITDLPSRYVGSDSEGVIPGISTEVVIHDELEKDLADLGFMPICACYDTGDAAFYSARSIQIPVKYDDELASINAHISSMMHSMLCVSRFAHYLKCIGRDITGRSTDVDKIQKELHNWIMGYVTSDVSASPETKAKYPLNDAKIRIHAVPGRSGAYRAVFYLKPHYEIEGLNAGISLITDLNEPG